MSSRLVGEGLTNLTKLVQFHTAFNIDAEERRAISWKLIEEEAYEVDEELREEIYEYGEWRMNPKKPSEVDVGKLAKELADLLYVCYGTALVYGIDLDHAVSLVHDSNMSKLDDDGNPILREDGKVLKGPNYSPPDMSSAVHSD